MGGVLSTDGVELFWIPLGLGPHGALVRVSGRLYEAVAAARARRTRCRLYHTALEVRADGVSTWVELEVPVRRGSHGIVAEGPVGARWLGRWRWFRFEVHCWTGGAIPDASRVGQRVTVSTASTDARRVLALVPDFPIHTWGRDEQHAGEMWNSNSLVSWLLSRAGLWGDGIEPPPGGRAPGWDAGRRVALRSALRPPRGLQQGDDATR
jgi:hypothetical protein